MLRYKSSEGNPPEFFHFRLCHHPVAGPFLLEKRNAKKTKKTMFLSRMPETH
nr:MAG TPA: hypothetical protein [Caudoviricetes sp.]